MQTKKSLSPEEAVEEYFDMLIKSRFIEMFGTVRDNTLSLPVQKMGDVVEIRNGRDYKVIQNDNGRYPVYGTGGIITYADDFLCPENTVIIGRKGTIDNPLLIKEKFWNVDTAFGMICNQLILNPIYYFWFCKQYDFKKHNKATTIPSLVKADLQKIDVIVPEKYKQDLFADFVKQVDKSKAICKQIFQSFDNLVKSRFIEMFDSQLFESKKLADLFKTSSGGTPLKSKKEYYEDGTIPWLTSGEIDRLHIDFARSNITQRALDETSAKIPPVKSVLVSMYGSVGYAGILEFEAAINQAICAIHPNPRFSPEWLCYYMRSKKDELTNQAVGAALNNISQEKIRNLRVPCPPLELQNEFTDFVRQVDKSKFSDGLICSR